MPSAIEKEHKKLGFFASLFKFGNFKKGKDKKDNKTHKVDHGNSDCKDNNNSISVNNNYNSNNIMTSMNAPTITQMSPSSLNSTARSV